VRAQAAGSSWKSPYTVQPASLSISPNLASFSADVKSSLYPDIRFTLEVRIHDDSVARVRLDQVGGLRKRYDEAASWALIKEPHITTEVQWKLGKKDVRAVYGPERDIELVVAFDPLMVTMHRKGKPQIVLNGRGLLHMEHFREMDKKEQPSSTEEARQDEQPPQAVVDVNDRAWFEGEEDAWWAETWSSWTDSKPKGKISNIYADTTLSITPR
jgi:alpha 1,3-glucosidase